MSFKCLITSNLTLTMIEFFWT